MLSGVGCALVETIFRLCFGLEAPRTGRHGSISLAMLRTCRATCLAIALLLRIRAGGVVTVRPVAAPKEVAKQPRKRAPAAVRSPRSEPDAVSAIARMTDAEALAQICKDLTLAAKALGLTEVIAEVAEMAREGAELLARPPAPLPRAVLVEAEIRRRRAARAAAASSVMVPGWPSAVAADAAGIAPPPPDSG
jgi:hypothetical protein